MPKKPGITRASTKSSNIRWLPKNAVGFLLVVVAVGITGAILLANSHAATAVTSAESEAGTASNSKVATVSDVNASNTQAVKFGSGSATNTIFSDNFPGTSLSPAWTVVSRHGEYAQNESECNTPGQVNVANNTLTITTIKQNTVCGDFNPDGSVRTNPSTWPYATGDVQWKSLNFTYGTITYRAKFPPQNTSTWPAVWLLGSNCQQTNPLSGDVGLGTCPNLNSSSYTELDLTECFAGEWCQFAMAQVGGWPTCHYSNPDVLDNNWHTFTFTWTKTAVSENIDGASTGCSFTSAQGYKIPSDPMFLIIQTQTGGVGNTPNAANLPATFQISNVTVTQP